jgi:hypothetical protein
MKPRHAAPLALVVIFLGSFTGCTRPSRSNVLGTYRASYAPHDDILKLSNDGTYLHIYRDSHGQWQSNRGIWELEPSQTVPRITINDFEYRFPDLIPKRDQHGYSSWRLNPSLSGRLTFSIYECNDYYSKETREWRFVGVDWCLPALPLHPASSQQTKTLTVSNSDAQPRILRRRLSAEIKPIPNCVGRLSKHGHGSLVGFIDKRIWNCRARTLNAG